MTFTQLLPSNSLRAVGTLAIEQVGEVVGIRWRQVGTQGRRSASVYFRYLDAAYAFAKAARRVGVLAFDPTGTYQRLNEAGDPVTHRYEPASYRGFAVLVMLTADGKHPSGWRQAPPFREQPATQQFGQLSKREQAQTEAHRQQREADAPLEDWYDEELERELDQVDFDIKSWWHGRGYTQDSPLAYLAKAEQRKAAAQAATRGPLWQERTRQAVAVLVAKHDADTIKQQTKREQQQGLRVNADDAEIIAALGHWDGVTDNAAAITDELENDA